VDGPRFVPRPPRQLSGAALEVHDDIVRTRAGLARVTDVTGPDGELLGPFGLLVESPEIGDAVQRVGTALREHAALPPPAVEAAILTVAQHWDAGYEWSAHEAVARASGALDDATIDLLRAGRPVASPPSAAVANAVTTQVLTTHGIDDDLYAAAVAEFGERGTIDLTLLIGYYVHLAILITASRNRVGRSGKELSP